MVNQCIWWLKWWSGFFPLPPLTKCACFWQLCDGLCWGAVPVQRSGVVGAAAGGAGEDAERHHCRVCSCAGPSPPAGVPGCLLPQVVLRNVLWTCGMGTEVLLTCTGGSWWRTRAVPQLVEITISSLLVSCFSVIASMNNLETSGMSLACILALMLVSDMCLGGEEEETLLGLKRNRNLYWRESPGACYFLLPQFPLRALGVWNSLGRVWLFSASYPLRLVLLHFQWRVAPENFLAIEKSIVLTFQQQTYTVMPSVMNMRTVQLAAERVKSGTWA